MDIFTPLEYRNWKLKNRIIGSALWLGGAEEGDVTEEIANRYAQMAQSGCSLLITGFAYVSSEGMFLPGMMGVESDDRIFGLKKLVDAVRSERRETQIFCQLVHTGVFRLPALRRSYEDSFAADDTPDPFAGTGGTGEIAAAASEELIASVIAKWAEAALRCKAAGFDGVELHFGHGFGPGAWVSPFWNHREDRWGGSIENRSRYGLSVLKVVRAAVGEFPLIAKINCEDGIEGGLSEEDARTFALLLAREGIDGITVSGGSPLSPPQRGPSRFALAGREGRRGEGYFAEAAGRIREYVREKGLRDFPVVSVGGWRSPGLIEKSLGVKYDAVALARPLLEDPRLVEKWKADPGFKSGCLSCNKCFETPEGLIVCRRDAK